MGGMGVSRAAHSAATRTLLRLADRAWRCYPTCVSADRPYKQIYFLVFAPFALQLGYLNLYYRRCGLDDDAIGTLAAAGSAMAVLSPLLWGRAADRTGAKRGALALLAVGTALAFGSIWFGRTLGVLLVLHSLLSFFRAPLIPLADALCLDSLKARGDHGGEHYARVRLWGSLGFVLVATFFPLLLRDDPPVAPLARLGLVFIAFPLLALLLVVRVWRLAEPPATPRPVEAPGDLATVAGIPQVKRLVLILLCGAMAQAGYYQFLSLYLADLGVSDRHIGIFWSVAVVAEILLMAVGRPLLRRVGVRGMILLGLGATAVRLFAYSHRLPPWVALVCCQPLHAFAFAALHLGSIAFLARTVPDRLRATGQALLASLAGGLGGALGSELAGKVSVLTQAGLPLAGRRGLYAAFWVCGWVAAGAFVAALLFLREPAERPIEEPLEAGLEAD
ncbi:MAG: MFS transporter [Armatimonadetes bacterium]|nr:MFS transporter [Armatimonadota bacterium]